MGYRGDRYPADSAVNLVAGTVRKGITNKFSTAGGAIAQPLPQASTLVNGDAIWIKKTAGSAALTVTPFAGDTINGSASAVTVVDSTLFLRDSTTTNWLTLAQVNASGGTLDAAYDFGGAGAGRTILADAGPVVVQVDGIGVGTTQALYLPNTTAAANGAQQYSPLLVQSGQGFKSNAPSASQAVDFATQVRPVQGTTAASGAHFWMAQIAGGGWTDLWSMTTDGQLRSNALNRGVYLNVGNNTGVVADAETTLRLVVGGTNRLSLSASAIICNNPITPTGAGTFSCGTAATPWSTVHAQAGAVGAVAFAAGAANTGMFFDGTNLGFAIGGTNRFSIGPATITVNTNITGAGGPTLGQSGAGAFSRAFLSSYIELTETTDPAAPAANAVRLYCRDNGAGKTQCVGLFNTGAVQVIITEP